MNSVLHRPRLRLAVCVLGALGIILQTSIEVAPRPRFRGDRAEAIGVAPILFRERHPQPITAGRDSVRMVSRVRGATKLFRSEGSFRLDRAGGCEFLPISRSAAVLQSTFLRLPSVRAPPRRSVLTL